MGLGWCHFIREAEASQVSLLQEESLVEHKYTLQSVRNDA